MIWKPDEVLSCLVLDFNWIINIGRKKQDRELVAVDSCTKFRMSFLELLCNRCDNIYEHFQLKATIFDLITGFSALLIELQ